MLDFKGADEFFVFLDQLAVHLSLRGYRIAQDSEILRQLLYVGFILSDERTNSVTAEELGEAIV